MVRIEEGKARSLYLCEQCAAQMSPLQKQALSLQEAIEKVLAQLVQKQGAGEKAEEEPVAEGPQCPRCGTSYAVFQKSLLLGCAECYQVFDEQLEPQLRKLHGSTRHAGSASPAARSGSSARESSVTALERELMVAVSSEDFQKAAQLRDRIRHLRGKAGHADSEMPEV
jgi:protein arginine kinase activator